MTSSGKAVATGEALVSFATKLPAFQVPEEELVVPSNLGRYGLSEVVNRLLGKEQPVPFDFLVDGEFLRTSIDLYLEVHKLSSEKVLQLEFVLALREPEQSTVDEAPEWVSSVVALEACPSTWFAATLYDGTVRSGSRDPGGSHFLAACGEPIDGLRDLATALNPLGQLRKRLVGLDGTLRAMSLEGAASGPVATLGTGGSAMQAAALSEDGTLLAGGGWSTEVLVFNTEPETFAQPAASRKRKWVAYLCKAVLGDVSKKDVTGDARREARPKFALKGHSQVVTALHFGKKATMPDP
ncbi:unnamed protein product [Effrenium voratum]|nr:unnamed protein product [Effrenium voratum]